ncbi:hypothetical protein MAR_026810 [Mya arenaria]|uniref:CUB domain-containing protein n=1 Tax=Mya arenaria TaxID=6604 RepID=A0ABY7ES09_MYAAR|nr:hypothetical protein MAR_026810 [Mya arenaria]
MHENCGGKINLRRESVFTANVEFRPSQITANNLNPLSFTRNNGIDDHGDLPADVIRHHGEDEELLCELTIESWDFQNRLLVHFEEVNLGQGVSNSICSVEEEKLLERSFMTSAKHLTFRYHGKQLADTDSVVRIVVVAFRNGPCLSYEYGCWTGHCIMEDLVCNGHNPCGDHSDCPISVRTAEVVGSEDDENIPLVVGVTVTSTLILIIGVAMLCRWYYVSRKHRHLNRPFTFELPVRGRPASAIDETTPAIQRSVSQVEAMRRNAPPSYSQLPILEQEHETDAEESSVTTPEVENCLDPDNQNPPSYVCVMLHREDYHVSVTSLSRDKDTRHKT